MTILFFGSSPYSVLVLQKLLKKADHIIVITTPDQPFGRSRKPMPNPVSQFCQKNKLPFHLDDRHLEMDIDIIVSADYGLKIPLKTLKKAKIGALNLHPSLLPKYRGATPVPHTLLAGETQTGISLIEMTEKIDQGPIIAQQTIPIKPQDTSETLLKHCFTLGAQLLIKTLPNYIEHKITPKPQPLKSPTPYTRRFTKQDGYISWPTFKSALSTHGQKLHNQIRALHPWPGVYTTLPNQKNLKILSAKLDGGKLLPTSIQLPGKKPISWQAFLAGYQHLLQ
jgi:methionyl-tRNA formyltransferase